MAQAYGYDTVSRLASLTNNLSGATNDLSQTFAYSPASQITQAVRTGDTYAWTGHFNTNVTGTANGLNQLTSVGPKSLTHDARGNVTSFGTRSFTYSSENLLLTGPGSTTLSYDPQLRLYQTVSGGTTTRLAYDGVNRIAEYDGSNVLQRRYVHGPGVDEPIVWYEGTGTTDRRFLSSDERGSIISLTDSSGALININKYDEYGRPQSTNLGVWGYTGQARIAPIGAWYYKARIYDDELGRFLQTDPVGGINLYAYVGNDPIGSTDPSGAIAFSLIAGEDTPRYWDESQPNLFGPHSYDWSGGAATFVSGRIDASILSNALNAWDKIGALATSYGSTAQCFMLDDCTNAAVNAFNAKAASFVNIDTQVSLFHLAEIEFEEAGDYAASSAWISRLSAIPEALDALEVNLRAVMSGLLVPDRASMSATQTGLPGGRFTYYNRYSVFSLPNNWPNTLSGPRIFWLQGSSDIYFAPFHGRPGPGVPTGFIRFRPELDW